MEQGRIIKALSGFYEVQAAEDVVTCKGRGLFRKQEITPLVGDIVSFRRNDDGTGTVVEIGERKNQLIRPPISNVDQAFIVSSIVRPDFSSLLIDRFLVLVEHKEIKPIILLTKSDLSSDDEQESVRPYVEDYRSIGYDVFFISKQDRDEEILKQLKPYLDDKVSVFAGQSGVGKSTILNMLDESIDVETNEISKSLGRGKHTTRHVELFQIGSGLIADTPGFSSLDFTEIEIDELRLCFPDFYELQNECKFRGCLHMNEPKCAVKDAVENEEIPAWRYKHYQQFYEEINSRKPRY